MEPRSAGVTGVVLLVFMIQSLAVALRTVKRVQREP